MNDNPPLRTTLRNYALGNQQLVTVQSYSYAYMTDRLYLPQSISKWRAPSCLISRKTRQKQTSTRFTVSEAVIIPTGERYNHLTVAIDNNTTRRTERTRSI